MTYSIIADYEICGKIHECLVYGINGNRGWAETVLNRMLTNPTANDKAVMGKGKNFRIEGIEEETAWWNDPSWVK